MISWIAILTVLVSTPAFETEHTQIRKLFEHSVYNEQKAISFSEEIDKLNDDLPKDIKMAYEGMSYLMLCKHTGSVYDKYNNFLIGKEKLETAISLSPQNIEFRFLRYGVQTNAPIILQYDINIEEDRTILQKFINRSENKKADPWLYRCITIYLNEQS